MTTTVLDTTCNHCDQCTAGTSNCSQLTISGQRTLKAGRPTEKRAGGRWLSIKLAVALLLSLLSGFPRLVYDCILGSADRRIHWLNGPPPWPPMLFLLCCICSWQMLLGTVESCATRPWTKSTPIRPTWSPDIHLERENCTDDYAALFCLNEGVCFRTKIVDTFIISCECKPGWYGHRCEYQDIGDRYLPVQQRLEVASIAGSMTVFLVIVVFVSVVLYIYYKRRRTATVGEPSQLLATSQNMVGLGEGVRFSNGKLDDDHFFADDSLKPVTNANNNGNDSRLQTNV